MKTINHKWGGGNPAPHHYSQVYHSASYPIIKLKFGLTTSIHQTMNTTPKEIQKKRKVLALSKKVYKKSLPRHPIRQVAPDQGKHPSLC